jgi:hypothetical protein
MVIRNFWVGSLSSEIPVKRTLRLRPRTFIPGNFEPLTKLPLRRRVQWEGSR